MPIKAKILIAEKDVNLGDVLKGLIKSLDYRVKVSGEELTCDEALQGEEWDVVVCELEYWRQHLAKQSVRSFEVIVTVDYAGVDEARQAVSEGAAGFIVRPVRSEQVLRLVEEVVERHFAEPVGKENPRDAAAVAAASPPGKADLHFGLLIGDHPLMQELYGQLEKVAATDMSVLIRGESGTGKELVAKAVHRQSKRSKCPFVAINCAAIPANLLESELFGHVKGAFTGAVRNKDGLFQAANGGTLFMDEIGSIPLEMQASLLRVLQDGLVRPVGGLTSFKVDVRVVAATNENLEQRMKDGVFREDLFYRLCAFPLYLPPLRERRDDIPRLMEFFIDKWRDGETAHFPGFTAEALDCLKGQPWPGNVRELENTLRRIVTLTSHMVFPLRPVDLPAELRQVEEPVVPEKPSASAALPKLPRSAWMTLKAYLRICEREYINQALAECGGDKDAVAAMLGISKGTLYRKLEEE